METASPIDVVSLISAFPESKVLADAEVPLVTIAQSPVRAASVHGMRRVLALRGANGSMATSVQRCCLVHLHRQLSGAQGQDSRYSCVSTSEHVCNRQDARIRVDRVADVVEQLGVCRWNCRADRARDGQRCRNRALRGAQPPRDR